MPNEAFSQILIDSLRDAGYEPQSYSGRGMYGRSCIGVTVPRGTSAFKLACQVIAASYMSQALAEDLADVLVREDSMGLDTILYFPYLPWVEADDEEEELAAGE